MKSHSYFLACLMLLATAAFAQQPGPNVNVLPAIPASNAQAVPNPLGTPPLIPPAETLTDFLRGDGYLQRQVEPSIAASTYNPDHIVAAFGDYRTVSLPETTTTVTAAGWMGMSRSYDRGQTWAGALIPGFPQDTSLAGQFSPLHGLTAGSDATIATNPGCHFYIGGLFFTPGGISKLAVVHYRDVPDTEGGDTIRYMWTSIVDTANASGDGDNDGDDVAGGNFIDKPSIAADIARGTNNPNICGPVYIAYTIFNGNPNASPYNSNIAFANAPQLTCGYLWSQPQYLNKTYKHNQGTAVAVDPNNGKVYVVWRHTFQAGGDGYPDSILMAVSSNGGRTFSSPVPITPSGWLPFDQFAVSSTSTSDPASNLTFRSLAFPTITIDGNSNVYVSTQEKVFGASGYYEPRVMIRTLKAGSNVWTSASPISLGSGFAQQVMPQLSFGAGLLKALWYDFRDQNTPSTAISPGSWYISGIDRQVKTYVAQVDVTKSSNFDGSGNPNFGAPAAVTQYNFNPYTGQTATVPGTNVPAVNRPNLAMYVNGTTAFEGDYIGNQVASPFVPNPGGSTAYRWATKPGDFAAASAYSAWTDSRDVVFPSYGSNGTPNMLDFSSYGWGYYAPPGTGNACYNAGARNANVYFSEIKPGVIAGSPNPNKQLVSSAGKPIERDFAMYVQNPNATTMYFVLNFVSGSGLPVNGSFQQGKEMQGLVTSTNITVLPLSTVTVTVYAYCPSCSSSAQFAPFSVSVTQTDSNFSPLSNPSQTLVAFDADPSAPLVNNIDTELHDATVSNPQFSNPQYATPQYATPQYATAQFSNPQYATPQYATTAPADGNVTPVGDFVWTVKDVGNTASAYVSLTNVAIQSLGSGYEYQVIISRAYNFPYLNSCTSQSIPTDQIISVINNNNLNFANPQYATPQYATPQYATAQYGDATFSAVPVTTVGSDNTTKMPRQPDLVYVVLRVYRVGGGTTPLSPTEVTNFLGNISQTVYPQAAPVSATKGTTTLALASSANPSVQGSSVTFTATITVVSNPANGGPTGTVSFYDGATSLGTGTVSANVATFTTSSLTPGLHTIVAKYSGDTNFLPSLATLGQTVTAPTTLALVSSPNPSVYGQPAPLTATVRTPFTNFTPTGTVTFIRDGETTLGSIPLNSDGQATLTPNSISVGSHSITASYSGDSNFSRSTSPVITQVVNPAATTTQVASGLNPSTFGSFVPFTASVAPVSPGAGTPTGTVTFYDGDGSIGSGVLNNGVATFSTSALSVGNHAIAAVYGGDGNFVGTASNTLTQQVLAGNGGGNYLFNNFNTAGVTQGANGPPTLTTFTLPSASQITQLATYHYNSGNGVAPGTIGFRNTQTQQVYGPFNATGAPGQGGANEAWVAAPQNLSVPAGTYLVLDSDPTTWSYNATSQNSQGVGNAGFARVWGFPAANLSFVTQPSNTTINQVITPAVQVKAMDATGAVLPAVQVTVSLNSGPGSLHGTLTQTTNSSGIATFADLSLDTNGTGDTLQASGGGGSVTSAAFNITASTNLAFVTQPSNTNVNHYISLPPGVQVKATDSTGAALPAVSITISLNSGPGTLNGTLTQMTDATGVATFGNLTIDTAGTGDTLQASAGGASLISATFNITSLTPVCSPVPAGLLSWYPLNGNPLDIRGGKPGTVVGTAGQFVPAEVGQGFKSGGPNTAILVPDSPTLALTEFSFGAWIRVDAIDNVQTMQIVWKGDSTGDDFSTPYSLSVEGTIRLAPGSGTLTGGTPGPGKLILTTSYGTATQIVVSNSALPTGSFNYVAATSDGSTITLYINGVADTQVTQSVAPSSTTYPLQIGGIQNGSNGFEGVIDELQIWSRALSLQEVAGMYNAGTAGECQNLWFTESNNPGKIGTIAPGGSNTTSEIPIPSANSDPLGIAWGPDGNIWFTEFTPTNIGVYAPSGPTFTEYPVGNFSSGTAGAYGITTGPDGNLWFTDSLSPQDASYVARISPSGVLTNFGIGSGRGPHGITAGPDGNLWFTEFSGNAIGRMIPSGPNAGSYTVFTIPTANSGAESITTGPDGNLWFTESNASKIGKITTSGVITEFTTPIADSGPWGITAGPDGNIWFTESHTTKIGMITPLGYIIDYADSLDGVSPRYITAGPDGNLWFTDFGTNAIGRITTSGVVSEFPLPTVNSGPSSITLGPAAPLPSPPVPPTNVTGTNPYGSPVINWTASTSPSVTTYKVYSATTSGGPYTLLGSTPSTSFTDTVATGGCGGTTFYYVVTAVGPGNLESVFSNETSVIVYGPC